MTSKMLILVVGLPGTGKTTFANLLSCKMAGIPAINTDVVKAAYLPLKPEILSKSSHTAWQLLGECTRENILAGNKILAQELFKISCDITRRLFKTYNTVIIEGLGIDLENVPQLEFPAVIFYLTNKNRNAGYREKLRYRVDKTNNWAAHEDILQIVAEELFSKVEALENTFAIEITAGYDLDEIVRKIEVCRENSAGGKIYENHAR